MYKKILRQAALRHPSEIMYPYDALIELDGFDLIYAFTELFGGTNVYVPGIKRILIRCLEAEVRREYRGCNCTQLAKKYGFTERHVYRLVK